MTRIAILGAGLAGIACARALTAAGATPVLYDKGRAAGGRIATRRGTGPDGSTLQWDHGAQYLTARDPGFAAALAEAGAAAWPDQQRFTGTPGITALPRALAKDLAITAGRHVTRLSGQPGAWMVHHADASLVRPGRPVTAAEAMDGPFTAVAITLPATQAEPVAGLWIPGLAARCAEAVYAPCWTVMAAFADRLDHPDTLRPTTGPIGWAARESSKPGRPKAEAWTIQANPAWSRDHLEDTPDQVLAALLAGFPQPLVASAHRWRYSLVETPLGIPCLHDPAAGLGLAGDWCLGGRAEPAWLSGTALAGALLHG